MSNREYELEDRIDQLEAELQKLKAAVRWYKAYAKGEYGHDMFRVICDNDLGDCDFEYAQTLLKVLEEK